MAHADDRPRLAPDVTRGAFPMTTTFLRGYLHQDWTADYESPEAALEAFLADASIDERRTFAIEAARLATVVDRLTLDEVRALLTERLGGAWRPESLGEVRRVFSDGGGDDEVDL